MKSDILFTMSCNHPLIKDDNVVIHDDEDIMVVVIVTYTIK